MTSESKDAPRMSAADVQRIMAAELSLRARLGYVALLLVSLAMAGLALALWLTEPALPARTQIAFLVLAAIALAWTAFAGWVLTRRRVLLAYHRIVASNLAVAFSAAFAAGALSVGLATSIGSAALPAVGVGAIMLVAAAIEAVRARKHFARLMARRRALEAQLAGRTS